MGNTKLVPPGSINCKVLPGFESRLAAKRPEAAFVTPATAVLAILLTIGLLGLTPAQGQMIERYWKIGGSAEVTWKDWGHINVLVDDFSVPNALQARELRPDVNIAPIVYSQFPYAWFLEPPDPFWEDGMPRLWRGWGTYYGPGEMTPFYNHVDGDRSTFVAFRGFRKTLDEFYTMDPGVPLPLERFVLQLPPPDFIDITGEPFENYVPKKGELSGSLKGEQLLANSKASGAYRPLDVILGRIEQNLSAPIEFTFPLQYLRYIRWRTFADYVDPSHGRLVNEKLGYAEFELFGRGFAGRARYQTRVVDLGQAALLGEVSIGISKWRREGAQWRKTFDAAGQIKERHWHQGELVKAPDADADLYLRLKTGTTKDPRKYFTYNDYGSVEEVDFATWQTLKKRDRWDPHYQGWQGPVTTDRKNWTPWSGEIRTSGTRLSLASGRYFQLQVKMESRKPTDVARLDSLRIELLPLLAPSLIGEVGLAKDIGAATLTQLKLGEPTELKFAIRAEFAPQTPSGFDAVHIVTPSTPEFVQLLMGDPLLEVEVSPDEVHVDSTGLTLNLPRAVAADEELQIRMRTALYTVSALLVGTVFKRHNSTVRQRITAGNATEHISTNQLQIVAADAMPEAIGELQIQPRTFTPNGDGHNDRALISYTLFGVLDATVEVTIFNLASEAVRRFVVSGQQAGTHPPLVWDGRGDTGQLLVPGLYLCQAKTSTSRGRAATITPTAITY